MNQTCFFNLASMELNFVAAWQRLEIWYCTDFADNFANFICQLFKLILQMPGAGTS